MKVDSKCPICEARGIRVDYEIKRCGDCGKEISKRLGICLQHPDAQLDIVRNVGGCAGHGTDERAVKAISTEGNLEPFIGGLKPRLTKHIVFRTLEEHGPATVDIPLTVEQRQSIRHMLTGGYKTRKVINETQSATLRGENGKYIDMEAITAPYTRYETIEEPYDED